MLLRSGRPNRPFAGVVLTIELLACNSPPDGIAKP